jgi:hypothetical protein
MKTVEEIEAMMAKLQPDVDNGDEAADLAYQALGWVLDEMDPPVED